MRVFFKYKRKLYQIKQKKKQTNLHEKNTTLGLENWLF